MNIIHIEYVGSDGATVEGKTFRFPYRPVMPTLARKLVKEGRSPGIVAHVTRGGVSVFANDLSLEQWAALTVEEKTHRAIALRPYRGPSDSLDT